jgi:cytidyltransferase-like protein
MGREISSGEYEMSAPPWQRVLSGMMRAVRIGRMPPGIDEHRDQLVFPGSFNPFHDGHRRMAELATQWFERPVEFELSVINVDKPTLGAMDVERRVSQFSEEQIIWVTRAPTFQDKIRLFPSATFIVGLDTLERLLNPNYHAKGDEGLAQTLHQIVRQDCKFVVFGRTMKGVFRDATDLNLPAQIAERCRIVMADEFRVDVSSTALRESNGQ